MIIPSSPKNTFKQRHASMKGKCIYLVLIHPPSHTHRHEKRKARCCNEILYGFSKETQYCFLFLNFFGLSNISMHMCTHLSAQAQCSEINIQYALLGQTQGNLSASHYRVLDSKLFDSFWLFLYDSYIIHYPNKSKNYCI